MNHTLMYFLIRAISGSIGLASIYILTRILSTAEYANFTLLIAILTFTSGISFQWLSIATSRLILEYKSNLYPFVKAVIFLFIISSIVSSLIIYISTYIYPNITENYYFILLFTTIILGMYNLLIQLANIFQKPLLYGSLSSSRAVFSLLLSVILIVYLNLNTFGAIIGFGTGFFIAIIIFLFYFKTRIMALFSARKLLSTIDNSQFGTTLFKYGVPLTFTYLAIMLINVSDRFMLAKMSTSIELASYSVASDLSQQTIGLLMNTLFLAYFPKVIQAHSEGSTIQLNNLMKQLGIFMLIIAVLVNIIYINASIGISNIMFGGELSQNASIIMPILSIGMAIGFYKNYYLDISFQVMKRTDMQFKITAIMAIVNLGLNMILIPSYGSKGASIATLIAFSVGAIISYTYSKKIMDVPMLSYDVLKIICVAFCVACIAWYFKFTYINMYNTLFNVVILILLYIFFLILWDVMHIQKKLLLFLGKGR